MVSFGLLSSSKSRRWRDGDTGSSGPGGEAYQAYPVSRDASVAMRAGWEIGLRRLTPRPVARPPLTPCYSIWSQQNAALTRQCSWRRLPALDTFLCHAKHITFAIFSASENRQFTSPDRDCTDDPVGYFDAGSGAIPTGRRIEFFSRSAAFRLGTVLGVDGRDPEPGNPRPRLGRG